MRDLRKKLMASIAMVVVAGVMLTGTSYAWFTLSTNPEVKGVTATATSNANLEIAYNEDDEAPSNVAVKDDTTKYDTYGNLVAMDTSTGNTASQANWRALSKELRPMTADSNVLKYMTYGTDGRPDELVALSVDSTNGCGNIYVPAVSGKNAKTNYGYYVRYWMRTNVKPVTNDSGTVTGPNNLYLTSSAARSNENGAESSTNKGAGTTITLTATGSTVSDTLLTDLIKHVRIGFSAGNPSVTMSAVIDPSGWTPTTGTNTVTLTLPAVSETALGKVDTGIDLPQNDDTEVYMYVYLDGTTMSNQLADAVSDGAISVSINAQFAIDNLDVEDGMQSTLPVTP